MQPRWPPQCQEHTGWAPPGPWLGLGPLPEHAPRLRGRLLSFLNSLLGPHLSREIGRAGRLSVPPPSAGLCPSPLFHDQPSKEPYHLSTYYIFS